MAIFFFFILPSYLYDSISSHIISAANLVSELKLISIPDFFAVTLDIPRFFSVLFVLWQNFLNRFLSLALCFFQGWLFSFSYKSRHHLVIFHLVELLKSVDGNYTIFYVSVRFFRSFSLSKGVLFWLCPHISPCPSVYGYYCKFFF